jgi:hypothetical protein
MGRGKAAFTRYKLSRASQVPGMHDQTFHASYDKFDGFNFEGSCDFHHCTCLKLPRVHYQHVTCTSQLASCKHGLSTISG